MSVELVGRITERDLLEEALNTEEAELIAVIGRRRVGKTFLVRQVYGAQMAFEMTGLQGGSRKQQLTHFAQQLGLYAEASLPVEVPDNWMSAFQLLIQYLSQRSPEEPTVVFFDELPWIATHRSGFLQAFGSFWNSWASQRKIVVVICGSAASWMIRHVVRNRGGLYNRITRRIFLQPFTLAETRTYLQSRNIRLDEYQIIQLYLVMGGIPHYLKEIRRGDTAVQTIDATCFAPTGLLHGEFDALYHSLFEKAERHIRIIRALSSVRGGMTRGDLLAKADLSNGGGSTTVLDELSSSGFITSYPTFGKSSNYQLFRLTDEYSYFYLKFIEPHRREGAGTWQRLSQLQTWKSWSGYAFETCCLKHLFALKRALGIEGTYTQAFTYTHRGNDAVPGFQIDLLLNRNDHTIDLFEIKFYQDTPVIDKGYAERLRSRIGLFRQVTATKKQLRTVFLSTFAPLANGYRDGVVDRVITMEDLFVEM